MNEKEMRDEIERLQVELAAMTKSRDRLREWLCQALHFEMDPEVLERETAESHEDPVGIDDLLQEVLPTDVQHLINEDAVPSENTEAVANA